MEKRLYRSHKDRIVFGICGGLGEYFNIDPVIIRVLFIVLTVATGGIPGILAYVIMALVIPIQGSTASTPGDSFRENVADLRDTTSNLGQNIRGTIGTRETQTPQSRTQTNNILLILGLVIILIGALLILGNILGWFWRFFWPVLLILGGVVIILLVTRRKN